MAHAIIYHLSYGPSTHAYFHSYQMATLLISKRKSPGTSLTIQWLGLHASNAGGVGSIPGWGTKIPHAVQHGQRKERKKRKGNPQTRTLSISPLPYNLPISPTFISFPPATPPFTDSKIPYSAMEYYSAIKKNAILPFVVTRMGLEGIMLSEISLTEKDKYCMISLACGI